MYTLHTTTQSQRLRGLIHCIINCLLNCSTEGCVFQRRPSFPNVFKGTMVLAKNTYMYHAHTGTSAHPHKLLFPFMYSVVVVCHLYLVGYSAPDRPFVLIHSISQSLSLSLYLCVCVSPSFPASFPPSFLPSPTSCLL